MASRASSRRRPGARRAGLDEYPAREKLSHWRFALQRTRRATALTLEVRRAAQYEQGFGKASCAHGQGADAESSCDDADDEQECGGVKHGELARLSSLQILRSKWVLRISQGWQPMHRLRVTRLHRYAHSYSHSLRSFSQCFRV
jgi:hypothetical protein